jgi:hypothetical protein
MGGKWRFLCVGLLVVLTMTLHPVTQPVIVFGQDGTGTCEDSDGGLVYEVSGYVWGVGPKGFAYTKYDECETGDYEGHLKEYYCNGTTPWPVRYKCPLGCAGGACLTTVICTDNDEDGYAVEGGTCGAVDCDDANPAVHPGATEICDNGIDDDCNGLTDVDDPACVVCTDSDGDGYAVDGGLCGPVDCDDANPAVHPGAAEICDNGIDDDCNGLTDADDPACLVCTDSDGDGYAVEGGLCGPVDCDDGNPAIHPGVREICDNGIDDNCNGLIDDDDPACGSMNVIIVGWDGVQRDHFWECYNRQLDACPNGLPNIAALSGGRIFNSTITNSETSTKPGWAQILTGYKGEVTGVLTNWHYQPIPVGYSLFEKVEDHLGPENIVTMFISGKAEHTGGACVGEPTWKNGQWVLEDIGQPWCLTKAYLDYFENDLQWNRVVGERSLALLEAHQHDRFLAFFMFWDPDVHGHLSGENSTHYSQQIQDDDVWLGRIVDKLKALGIDDRTMIYVITDHGFDEGLKTHMNAPYGFMASNDPRVIRSGDRLDLTPTLLESYGISLGALGSAPAVDGQSLFSYPAVSCIAEGGAFLDYPGAPTCCAGLTWIGLDKRLGASCTLPTGGTGDTSGYCTLCGDGLCTAPENKCSCPVDCPS